MRKRFSRIYTVFGWVLVAHLCTRIINTVFGCVLVALLLVFFVVLFYNLVCLPSVSFVHMWSKKRSGAPLFTLSFSGVRVARSLAFYVVFCRSLFVLFIFAIVLSGLLRFTDSDYHPLVYSNLSF